MATVTGDLGGQPISLDNAATEATLQAILSTMQRQNQYILQNQRALNQISLNSRGGPQGGGNAQAQQAQNQALQQATQNQTQNTQATAQATRTITPMGVAARIVGGILGDLASSAFKTVGNLTDFAGQLIDGQGSLSGFYGALKDLPLGLGMVAGLFQKIALLQEAELKTYRDLTQAGVNFGGALNEIRATSLSLGLTMDEYAGVIKKNQSALAMLGENTNVGAIAFNKMAKELRQSPIGEQLRAMGVTSEQAANGLGTYIRMTGARSKEELKNTGAIAEAAGRYMKNLDALSQLTGESKEALEAKMAEEAQEAQWQAYLAGLDAKAREKANAAVLEAGARGGKGLAQAVKDITMVGVPLTELGQQSVAQSQTMGKAAYDYAKSIKDNSKTLEDQKRIGDAVTAGLAREQKERGALNLALARESGPAAEIANAQARALSQATAQNIKTQEDATDRRLTVEQQQNALTKSSAAAAVETEKAFKDLGEMLYGALRPAIAALTPVVNDLAMFMIGMAKENMPQLQEAMKTLGTFVTNFAKDLFSEAGRAKIINDLSYAFEMIMIEVKKKIMPKFMYDESDAQQDRAKAGIEKEKYDKAAEEARLVNDLAGRRMALEKEKDTAKKAEIQQEIDTILARQVKVKEEASKAKTRASEVTQGEENQKTAENVGGVAGVVTGAAAGAAIGSIVPVIGTLFGGLVGALIGGTAGAFGGGALANNTPITEEERKKYNPKPVEQRAIGGPVDANTPYWVGEKGPELFKPKMSGEIIPTEKIPQAPKEKVHFDRIVEEIQSQFSNVRTDDFKKVSNDLTNMFSSTIKDLPQQLAPDISNVSLPEFKNFLPESIGNIFNKVNELGNNITNKVSEIVTPKPADTLLSTEEKKLSNALNENLVKELQQLNKQTTEMIRFLRMNVDETRLTVSGIRGLSGNLYS